MAAYVLPWLGFSWGEILWQLLKGSRMILKLVTNIYLVLGLVYCLLLGICHIPIKCCVTLWHRIQWSRCYMILFLNREKYVVALKLPVWGFFMLLWVCCQLEKKITVTISSSYLKVFADWKNIARSGNSCLFF